ncbi:hypothetical protein [Nocardia grenadensis]
MHCSRKEQVIAAGSQDAPVSNSGGAGGADRRGGGQRGRRSDPGREPAREHSTDDNPDGGDPEQ